MRPFEVAPHVGPPFVVPRQVTFLTLPKIYLCLLLCSLRPSLVPLLVCLLLRPLVVIIDGTSRQTCGAADRGSHPSITGNGTNNRPTPRAYSPAAKYPLLGRSHV